MIVVRLLFAQAKVESIGSHLIASRLERQSPAGTRNVRNLNKRIQHDWKTLRENVAVIHTWDCAAASEMSVPLPAPLTEEQIQDCGRGIYPWRPEGQAATALPYLAARYRDAFAEVRIEFKCKCIFVQAHLLLHIRNTVTCTVHRSSPIPIAYVLLSYTSCLGISKKLSATPTARKLVLLLISATAPGSFRM